MPPTQETGIQWNKVTWYSKASAVLLFVICVGGAFYLGIYYQRQISLAPIPTAKNATTSPTPNQTLDDTGVIANFTKNLQVIRTISDPFDSPSNEDGAMHVVHIVTTKGDDVGCGGKYSYGLCYFFTDLTFPGGSPVTYVHTWEDRGLASMDATSVKFIDQDTLQFTASGGDAGTVIDEVWTINVLTGSTTRISSQETHG